MNRIFLPYIPCIFLLVLAVQPIAPAANEVLYDYAWNMPAMAIDFPEGWGGEYAIRHDGVGDWDIAYIFQDTATGRWVQKFPQQDFVYYELKGNHPPQVVNSLAAARTNKPISAAEVLDVFIDNRADEGITVLERNIQGDELRAMKENTLKSSPVPPPFRTQFSSYSVGKDGDIANMLVEYEKDGVSIQEFILCIAIYNQTHVAYSWPAYSEMLEIKWHIRIFVFGSPAELAEQPDDGAIAAMLASMKPLPRWQAALNAETQRAWDEAKRNLDSQDKMWKNAIKTQQDIFQSRQEVLNNRATAQSNAFNKMTDVIAGRELVQNPYGGDIYIDYSKNHVWIDKNNNLQYSDSSLFNPNQLPGSSGSYVQIK